MEDKAEWFGVTWETAVCSTGSADFGSFPPPTNPITVRARRERQRAGDQGREMVPFPPDGIERRANVL